MKFENGRYDPADKKLNFRSEKAPARMHINITKASHDQLRAYCHTLNCSMSSFLSCLVEEYGGTMFDKHQRFGK